MGLGVTVTQKGFPVGRGRGIREVSSRSDLKARSGLPTGWLVAHLGKVARVQVSLRFPYPNATVLEPSEGHIHP